MNFSTQKLRTLLGMPSVRITLALATTASTLALYAFACYYVISASGHAAAAEQSVRIEKLKSEKTDATKRMLAVRGSDLAKLDSYVVHRGTLAHLIEKIEALAARAGVTVEINQAQIADGGLTLDLTTDGSFSNSYYFLTLLESLPIPINFRAANFNSAHGSTGPGKRWHANYSIQIASYVDNA